MSDSGPNNFVPTAGSDWPDLAPTPEQCERFRQLTPEQRFHWLTDMLQLMYDLATPEARAAWRRHKGDEPDR